jgi:hypothetical protein
MAALFRAGMSQYAIGRIFGCYQSTVRYHLRRQPGYGRLVTAVLVGRANKAAKRYFIARTLDTLRRLKLDAYILKRERPEAYPRWLESLRCPKCRTKGLTRVLRKRWRFICGECLWVG